MNKCYKDEEAAEDTEAAGSWSQAWRKTINLAVGDYLVIVSFNAYNDLGYVGSHYRVQMDDTTDIFPDTQVGMINAGEKTPVTFHKVVNVASAGNKNFDFDLKSSGGGEVAKISDKRLAVVLICL